MSVYFEKIPLPDNELFLLRSFEVQYMSYPMHYHPEIEITFIKRSYGQRFVGDHMENFNDGDLVMIGPNLPHQWRNDIYFKEKKGTASLSVIHFSEDSLSGAFNKLLEFSHIRQLLEDSRRGVKFSINCIPQFVQALDELEKCPPSDKLLCFFNMLNVLAKSSDRKILSGQSLQEIQADKTMDKINQVYSFILDNYHQEVSLSDVANSIHLSNSAFSHFIKKRTGMTFSQLVNDLRTKYAGKLLTESDLNITEICFKSGFRNLSYFNRQFKAFKKSSPLEYRKKFRKEYMDSYTSHKNLEISTE